MTNNDECAICYEQVPDGDNVYTNGFVRCRCKNNCLHKQCFLQVKTNGAAVLCPVCRAHLEPKFVGFYESLIEFAGALHFLLAMIILAVMMHFAMAIAFAVQEMLLHKFSAWLIYAIVVGFWITGVTKYNGTILVGLHCWYDAVYVLYNWLQDFSLADKRTAMVISEHIARAAKDKLGMTLVFIGGVSAIAIFSLFVRTALAHVIKNTLASWTISNALSFEAVDIKQTSDDKTRRASPRTTNVVDA